MYFLLLMLKSGQKRSALQPQTIYSEVPLKKQGTSVYKKALVPCFCLVMQLRQYFRLSMLFSICKDLAPSVRMAI